MLAFLCYSILVSNPVLYPHSCLLRVKLTRMSHVRFYLCATSMRCCASHNEHFCFTSAFAPRRTCLSRLLLEASSRCRMRLCVSAWRRTNWWTPQIPSLLLTIARRWFDRGWRSCEEIGWTDTGTHWAIASSRSLLEKHHHPHFA